MLEFKEGKEKFVKYYLGSKEIRSHVDAVHAFTKINEFTGKIEGDEFTGDIVEGIFNKINCSGIIATKFRDKGDMNRDRNPSNEKAYDEYCKTIKELLEYTNEFEKGKISKPHLHLAIHGIMDYYRNKKGNLEKNPDIEIGTKHGETCSLEVREWFIDELKKQAKDKLKTENIIDDREEGVRHPGDNTLINHSLLYGVNFNTFQIEINKTLRKKYQKELIDIFSDIILKFNDKF